MEVKDPPGNTVLHSFVLATSGEYPYSSPAESDISYKAADGTELMTVHKDYELPQYTCATSPQPTKITTTLKGNGRTSSSYVNLTYQRVMLRDDQNTTNRPCSDQYFSMTDNVQTRDEYDFDAKLIRSTSQDWTSGSPEGAHILDRLNSRVVSSSDATFTASHTWDYDSKGNLNSETTGGTNAASATTLYGRDSYGRLTSVTDPKQYAEDSSKTTTAYNYTPWNGGDCAPGISSAPVSIVNKQNQSLSMVYNPCTGTVASRTDSNQQTTKYTYDSIGRQISVARPDGGSSQTTFMAGPGGLTLNKVWMDSRSIVSEEDHDGLGRPVQIRNQSTAEGTTYVDTTYDLRGLIASETNPYTGSKTGSVTFEYDALGRRRYQCNQDNGSAGDCVPGASYRETVYAGNQTTEYDELRNATKKQSDALGRLTDVWEPDSSGVAALHTQYKYDANDDLLSVQQYGSGGDTTRSRSFKYTGRSQLMYSQNPETGVICYGQGDGTVAGCQGNGYDLNGNLLYKTDAMARVSSYVYDKLNRLVSTTFNDTTPSSCNSYDTAAWSPSNARGRLTAKWTKKGICDAAVPSNVLTKTQIASYDQMGRVTLQTSCVLGRCSSPRAQAFTYDYLGHETSAKDGRDAIKFLRTYDSAGRFWELDSMIGGQQSSLYKVRAYGPAGWTDALQGTSVKLCRSFDSRMRVADMTATADVASCR